jgi:hypothetical protein
MNGVLPQLPHTSLWRCTYLSTRNSFTVTFAKTVLLIPFRKFALPPCWYFYTWGADSTGSIFVRNTMTIYHFVFKFRGDAGLLLSTLKMLMVFLRNVGIYSRAHMVLQHNRVFSIVYLQLSSTFIFSPQRLVECSVS